MAGLYLSAMYDVPVGPAIVLVLSVAAFTTLAYGVIRGNAG